MKKCSKCKLEKDVSCYCKDKSRIDGLYPICKECSKQYRLENAEKINLQRKEYRLENADRVKFLKKNYYQRRKDFVDMRNKQYKLENLERHKQYQSEYRKKNKHKRNSIEMKRRCKKKNLLHKDHNTNIENRMRLVVRVLNEISPNRYAIDHIFPLGKGGPHHHDNLQIIEASINSMKKDSITFNHPNIKHWTELPQHVMDMIDPIKLKQAFDELNVV